MQQPCCIEVSKYKNFINAAITITHTWDFYRLIKYKIQISRNHWQWNRCIAFSKLQEIRWCMYPNNACTVYALRAYEYKIRKNTRCSIFVELEFQKHTKFIIVVITMTHAWWLVISWWLVDLSPIMRIFLPLGDY